LGRDGAALASGASQRIRVASMQGLSAAAIAHGLGVALCVVSPRPAGAQSSGVPSGDANAAAAGVDPKPYHCVDPADVQARRWLQNEPCRLPLVRLPPGMALGSQAPPRGPTSLPPLPDRGPGHAMFWRFPVQPLGPYEAPRHWR
jgi:hypothetical protein